MDRAKQCDCTNSKPTPTCIHHLLCQLSVVSCNVAQAPGGSLLHPWVKLLEACHQTVQGTTVNHSLCKLRGVPAGQRRTGQHMSAHSTLMLELMQSCRAPQACMCPALHACAAPSITWPFIHCHKHLLSASLGAGGEITSGTAVHPQHNAQPATQYPTHFATARKQYPAAFL
jgi:hypothetical protein